MTLLVNLKKGFHHYILVMTLLVNLKKGFHHYAVSVMKKMKH